MTQIITIKPKACKNCEHWELRQSNAEAVGMCGYITGTNAPVAIDGARLSGNYDYDVIMHTGPDFYCAHFKEKGEE